LAVFIRVTTITNANSRDPWISMTNGLQGGYLDLFLLYKTLKW